MRFCISAAHTIPQLAEAGGCSHPTTGLSWFWPLFCEHQWWLLGFFLSILHPAFSSLFRAVRARLGHYRDHRCGAGVRAPTELGWRWYNTHIYIYIILYYTILYYIMLYYIILYYVILYYIIILYNQQELGMQPGKNGCFNVQISTRDDQPINPYQTIPFQAFPQGLGCSMKLESPPQSWRRGVEHRFTLALSYPLATVDL